MPPSTASSSGLGFSSVPSNKENSNIVKKHVLDINSSAQNSSASHQGESSGTTVLQQQNSSAHHHSNIPQSASQAVSHALNKMSLKAREFGKEITNGTGSGSGVNNENGHPSSAASGAMRAISSGGSMFSSTMHNVGPLTVKHAEAQFHHNHP